MTCKNVTSDPLQSEKDANNSKQCNCRSGIKDWACEKRRQEATSSSHSSHGSSRCCLRNKFLIHCSFFVSRCFPTDSQRKKHSFGCLRCIQSQLTPRVLTLSTFENNLKVKVHFSSLTKRLLKTPCRPTFQTLQTSGKLSLFLKSQTKYDKLFGNVSYHCAPACGCTLQN